MNVFGTKRIFIFPSGVGGNCTEITPERARSFLVLFFRTGYFDAVGVGQLQELLVVP